MSGFDTQGMLRSVSRPMLGGLDTKTPPTLLTQDRSPDLLNVVQPNRAIERRGGFSAMRSQQPKLNSLRNVGYHTRSRLNRTVGSADGEFLIVPGCLHGGHRGIYENLTAGLTVEFFFEVGDLTDEHGGNAEETAATFGPAPYTLMVRPVLFKGPIKRTANTTIDGPHTNATPADTGPMRWDTRDQAQWGSAAGSGLPFGIYLFNNSGIWEWRFSFHTFDGLIWQLRTAVSSVAVEVGARYHVIAQVDTTTDVGTLRVARLRGKETPTYASDTVSFSGDTYTSGNLSPIQVFDCPQQFIEASTTGTATLRPGLGINTSASGGYWFGAKRAEGTIEDIAIYKDPQITATATALDRTRKLATLPDDLIGYWSMTEPGEGYVQEMTGRGNHLYLVPAGPTYDPISGGPRPTGSWYFNGTTSYVLAHLENATNFDRSHPSWRYLKDGPVPGWMTDAVRENHGHGIMAEFWVDAIEPNFEQVVVEAHSVLRLAIDRDGKLVGYCRDGTGAPGTALQAQGATYQGPVTSSFTVKPGKRYAVALFRRTGGTDLDLFVNGVLDATASGLNASNSAANDGRPVSGMTFGMGSFRPTIRNDASDWAPPPGPGDNLPDINDLNTDPRSGFVGRIEAVSVLGSDATVQQAYKDQGEADQLFEQSGLWENPFSGLRTLIRPLDQQPVTAGDTVANVGSGVALEISGHEKDLQPVRYLVTDTSVPDLYTLSQDTLLETDTGALAHLDLEALRIKTWHTVFRWVMNAPDPENRYGGSYHWGIEYGYDATATLTSKATQDYFRSIHIQKSLVISYGSGLHRRCVESDLMDPNILTSSFPWVISHRNKPYRFKSPRELAPQWSEGIVQPLAGTNPLTLVADWEDQSAGERFVVVGCGRQLYWSRPSWRKASPYTSERNTQSLWLGGQQGDHIRVAVPADTELLLTGTGPTSIVEIQVWLYPYRLDGTRMVCGRVSPATNAQTNFLIYFQDGQLRVEGTLDGNTKAWAFYEGDAIGSNSIRADSGIRANAWNHLQVVIKNGFVDARLNGNFLTLFSLHNVAGANADAIGSGAPDAPSGEFYLGGLPPDRHRLTFTATPGNRVVDMQSWHGLMADFRQRDAEHPAFPAFQAGTPPKSRLTVDGDTFLLLPLNEGAGFHVFDTAAVLSSLGDGQIEQNELLTLIDGLEESTDARYDHIIFRDRLLVTNGRSFPHAIRFTRLTDPDGPFRVERVGMEAPIDSSVEFNAEDGVAAGTITDGVYIAQMTFVNADGKESEPLQLGSHTVTGGPFATLDIRIRNVPRSPDLQVVARNFYVSANGGGNPIFYKQIPDNETTEVDFEVASHPNVGLATEVGVRLPAPRGKHIAVAQSSLMIGDLTDIDAGQNAFAVSRSDEPSYYTIAGSAIIIDSEDGKPITGMQGHLSRLNISKRDSIWQFAVDSLDVVELVRATLQIVNTSAGFGGGRAVQDNLIYGAGDRGVYAFNNSSVRYDGDPLEGDWLTDVDKSDPGIVSMFGSWFRPGSQYWLSVRLLGERFNRRAYVLHTASGEALAWTRLELPEHSYLTEVLDPVNQNVLLALGSTSGSLLQYRSSVDIDYHDGSAISNATLQLEAADGVGGESLTGTATTLNLSGSVGEFDDAGQILRGAEVTITYSNGVALLTETRRIEAATRTSIEWTEGLPGFVDYSGGSYVIGGFESFWTSGWFSNQYGSDQKLEMVDFDFLPTAGSADVVIRTARATDAVTRAWADGSAANDEPEIVDMTTGYMNQPIKVQGTAYHRWVRIRIGTDGISKPFGVVGWSLRTRQLAARGTPGSLA